MPAVFAYSILGNISASRIAEVEASTGVMLTPQSEQLTQKSG